VGQTWPTSSAPPAPAGPDWHGPEAPNAQPGVDLPDDRSATLLAWLAPHDRSAR